MWKCVDGDLAVWGHDKVWFCSLVADECLEKGILEFLLWKYVLFVFLWMPLSII